jgi:hypothetical protein
MSAHSVNATGISVEAGARFGSRSGFDPEYTENKVGVKQDVSVF